MQNISNKLKTTDLIERGWTRGLIKKFLPVPCLVLKNTYSHGITNLYSFDKIEKTEQSADFQAAQSKALKKSETAKKTADKRRAKIIEQAQKAEISVETVKIQKLRQLAVNAYNDWNLSKFADKRATIHDDSLFLDRITVNFIRHNLTVYDFLLVQQWGKVGKNYAVEIIRNRIFDLIAKKYPDLAQEAIRQKIAKRPN